MNKLELVRERNLLLKLLAAEELGENQARIDSVKDELNDIEDLIRAFERAKTNSGE